MSGATGEKRRRSVRLLALPQWSPLSMSGATFSVQVGARSVVLPQWSPLSMSGATHREDVGSIRCWMPQWSPLSMSGATSPRWAASPNARSRNGARSR